MSMRRTSHAGWGPPAASNETLTIGSTTIRIAASWWSGTAATTGSSMFVLGPDPWRVPRLGARELLAELLDALVARGPGGLRDDHADARALAAGEIAGGL